MKLPTILKQKKHCPSAILTKDNESVVHRPVWQAVVFFVIQGPQLSQYAFLMVTSHCCCLVPLHHLSNKPAQRYLISIFHSLCVCVCLCVCACACETCKPTFPHQWDYDFHMQTILPWNCQDKVTQYCLVTVWPFWKKSTNISLASPVISLCGRTYQTKAAMWGDMFYSATITLVPPVTLVLHGLLPLHSLYNIHVLLHNIYDIPFLLSKYLWSKFTK